MGDIYCFCINVRCRGSPKTNRKRLNIWAAIKNIMSKKGKTWQNRDREYNITPLELLDIYHRLEKLFDDVAILGGRAVNIYISGDKRFTKDIDVVVKLPDVPLKTLKDEILKNGFIYETYDDGKLKKLVNKETNTSIDLYYSADLGGISIEDLLGLAKARTIGHDNDFLTEYLTDVGRRVGAHQQDLLAQANQTDGRGTGQRGFANATLAGEKQKGGRVFQEKHNDGPFSRCRCHRNSRQQGFSWPAPPPTRPSGPVPHGSDSARPGRSPLPPKSAAMPRRQSDPKTVSPPNC